jgi:hypothetical protein
MGSHALIATYAERLPARPSLPENRRDSQDAEHDQGYE